MEKAETIIKDALQEISIAQESEAAFEAEETQDAIRYLNRMMAAFASNGITLGFTQVSTLGDLITVPDGALEGMVKNLAVRLFSQFSIPGTPIPALLLQEARQGRDDMRAVAIDSIGPALFPGTMPIGSGNETTPGLFNDHFYKEDGASVELEQGGVIGIETDTEIPNDQ